MSENEKFRIETLVCNSCGEMDHCRICYRCWHCDVCDENHCFHSSTCDHPDHLPEEENIEEENIEEENIEENIEEEEKLCECCDEEYDEVGKCEGKCENCDPCNLCDGCMYCGSCNCHNSCFGEYDGMCNHWETTVFDRLIKNEDVSGMMEALQMECCPDRVGTNHWSTPRRCLPHQADRSRCPGNCRRPPCHVTHSSSR